MISRKAALAVLMLVAACGGRMPDSNPYVGGGVGFGGIEGYAAEQARRDAALQSGRSVLIPEEQAIASETLGVLNSTRPLGAPLQPVSGATQVVAAPIVSSPSDAAPLAGTQQVAISNPGISDEQNFDAVASRETIESDAERLARQRAAYEVVQPEAVPERPGSTGPNIVSFALSSSNRVGEQVYRRSGTVGDSKFQRACARFASSDQAQQAFLEAGGPRRDRQGLDPDGDGFACYWDPTPFRAARGG